MTLATPPPPRHRPAPGSDVRAFDDALAETLVAFANGDGGTVLLGADAQGNIDR